MLTFTDQPLFITGLPRSGTSLVAGLLNQSGFWAGSTVAATAANPKGFFEHAMLREQIVKKILIQLKSDPLGVNPLPDLNTGMGIKNLSEMILKIIKDDGYNTTQPWLFKDAKLSLTWPFFYNAFPKARWLIVERPSEQVIKSCLNTSFMQQHSREPEFWGRFINQYQQRLTLLTETVEHSHVLPVEMIFNGDFSLLESIANDYELTLEPKILSNFIDPNHWHHGNE